MQLPFLRKEQDAFTASIPQNAVWNDYAKSFASGPGTSAPAVDKTVLPDILVDELLQDYVNEIEAPEESPALASTNARQLVTNSVTLPVPQGGPALDSTRRALLQPNLSTIAVLQPPALPQLQFMPTPGWQCAPAACPTLLQDPVSCSKRKRKKLEVEYCCSRMQTWCEQSGRKGRMPHNEECPRREKNRRFKRKRKAS